jgi:hypothetical protein
MSLDRIATSGLQAHLRLAENAAHNVSQLGVGEPVLLRTRFQAQAPHGTGGVRAETEIRLATRPTSSGPVLSPDIHESLVRDDVDLVQELTDTFIARRGFQANLAAQRASRSFLDATLNLAA